jgi:hypothetical protein
MTDTPPLTPDQPPYDANRYAPYTPEPWDVQPPPTTAIRVWYGFIAFTVAVMIMGALLILAGVTYQTMPDLVLQAQADINHSHLTRGQQPVVHNAAEVKSMAIPAYSIGAFFLLAGAIVFALPHSIWRWTYGLFVIALAFISCFLAPFAIVMLIFWLLPSTRTWFATPRT